MKTSFNRLVLVPSLLLAIPAFFLGFGLAYHQDEIQALNVGNLAWLHLSYAEELKDDMAIIDWSKNLEKLDGLRAFEVISGSKIIAEGGNRNYLPSAVPEGAAYLFPGDWTLRMVSEKPPAPSLEFTLVLHPWPGPLFLGGIFFGICLASGCALGWFSIKASLKPISMKTFPDEIAQSATPAVLMGNRGPGKSTAASLKKNTAYLFIDKDYVIRQVSPEAAAFLKKNSEELLNAHLLDLTPNPDLIQAFEKAGEATISKPFLDHSDLLAHLKPENDGCIVVLERTSGPQPL